MVLLLVGWGVDSSLNNGSVARGVTISGTDVSGMSDAELEQALAEVAAGYADTEVIIRTADGEVKTTAGVVGLELDPDATAENIMAIGRGSIASRPVSWLQGIFGSRTAEAAVRLGEGDEEALEAVVNAGQPKPKEPELVVADGLVVVEPGESVQTFDISTIRDDVVEAASAGVSPIVVEAGAVEVAPEMTDSEAQVFADEFNAMTANGIETVVRSRSERFGAEELRSWMVLERIDEGFEFELDQETTKKAVSNRYSDEQVPIDDLEVTIVDGKPTLVDYAPTACCADDSAERIQTALEAGRTRAALVHEEVESSEEEILAEIGIKELISEATTPHDCCASRVTNIQLFADLMTGVIIEPGETLSLNDHVGRRTREKGFVESGVIYLGRLQTDVGGGISQFATTIFQAMFYGGIDIDEYQAHTLWFSRYEDFEGRRGIESTISFPEPDVQFTNNTPYPLMIWPSYTDTSLTVSLYSTTWTETTVANQDIFSSGLCTVIDTDRLRKFGDGTEEIDTFRALYQPSDGIGCDGRPTDPNAPTPTPEPKPKKKKNNNNNTNNNGGGDGGGGDGGGGTDGGATDGGGDGGGGDDGAPPTDDGGGGGDGGGGDGGAPPTDDGGGGGDGGASDAGGLGA